MKNRTAHVTLQAAVAWTKYEELGPRCLKTCLTRDLCDLYRNLFASQLHTKYSRLLGGFNRFFMILHSDSSYSQCQVVLLGS